MQPKQQPNERLKYIEGILDNSYTLKGKIDWQICQLKTLSEQLADVIERSAEEHQAILLVTGDAYKLTEKAIDEFDKAFNFYTEQK